MHPDDRDIMFTFFKLQELRRERLRLQRIWEPESFKWTKKGAPPKQSWSTAILQEALDDVQAGPVRLAQLKAEEEIANATLERLASEHPLGLHFQAIKGLGDYLCGAFIAAAGDISRAPTVSCFWRGMGLDVVDGKAPRRIRGNKEAERGIPCMPHVSLAGEQIRMQIVRSGDKLAECYQTFRDHYDRTFPDAPKILNFKRALRRTQKLLYACLWREYRIARGLPVPDDYAHAVLGHESLPTRIQDFYAAPVSRG